VTEQPARKLLDQLSDAELTALYDALDEARQWARHGYEIGQRHCGWSDHGVAPTWLTEGWPRAIDSCDHLHHLTQAEDTIARVRRLASGWALLRTHGAAAYELRAALEPQEPTP
jgi:hypothetical protein